MSTPEDHSPAENAPSRAEQMHSFSRTIAKQHGEKAAVILQYLAHHVAKSKHTHNGRKWFYKTLDDLAKAIPYLKRSTIHDTLRKLGGEGGPLMIGDYNKKGYDRTCWYAFRDANFRKTAQSSEPAYFRVEDAVKYGIVGAVLLANLEYWVRENRKKDPQYTWHTVSLGELAKHLPFSKASLHRAFKKLVDSKVLRCRDTECKRGIIEYALTDETRLTVAEEGGPNPDMGGGATPGTTVSKSDETVSDSDMTVSKPDLTVSNPDMTVSFSDNNTILIDNPLKDPSLKDPGYVEPGLPNPITNTLKTSSFEGVKDFHPFARPVTSGAQPPQEIPGKDSDSPGSPTASGSSALSSVVAPVATSLPSASASEQSSSCAGAADPPPFVVSRVLEDQFYKNVQVLRGCHEKTAEAALKLANTWVYAFLLAKNPEDLAPLFKIGDQEALYAQLSEMFIPHLAKALEPFLDNKDELVLAEFASHLAIQFLTQGFTGLMDEKYQALGSGDSYMLTVSLRRKMRPYWDELDRNHRGQIKAAQEDTLKQRAEKYASPDMPKEPRADLSAAEKVRVLRHSLAARNSIGRFSDNGELVNQVVIYNERTFTAAHEFFKANPDFTVADLNRVVDKCLALPKEPPQTQTGSDPLWHARKGNDINFLLQHLDIIVASLNCVDEVADFQVLHADQLFKRRPRKPSK